MLRGSLLNKQTIFIKKYTRKKTNVPIWARPQKRPRNHFRDITTY